MTSREEKLVIDLFYGMETRGGILLHEEKLKGMAIVAVYREEILSEARGKYDTRPDEE